MGRGALTATLVLALLVAGLTGAVTTGAEPDVFSAMSVLRPAAPTPPPDLAFRSLDGREVRLRDLRGKAVLLGFFTTW